MRASIRAAGDAGLGRGTPIDGRHRCCRHRLVGRRRCGSPATRRPAHPSPGARRHASGRVPCSSPAGPSRAGRAPRSWPPRSAVLLAPRRARGRLLVDLAGDAAGRPRPRPSPTGPGLAGWLAGGRRRCPPTGSPASRCPWSPACSCVPRGPGARPGRRAEVLAGVLAAEAPVGGGRRRRARLATATPPTRPGRAGRGGARSACWSPGPATCRCAGSSALPCGPRAWCSSSSPAGAGRRRRRARWSGVPRRGRGGRRPGRGPGRRRRAAGRPAAPSLARALGRAA